MSFAVKQSGSNISPTYNYFIVTC